jgi:uncharacterized protein YigE (DUF2233 family)
MSASNKIGSSLEQYSICGCISKCILLLILLSSKIAYSQGKFIDYTAELNKQQVELRLLDSRGKPIGSFNNLKRELLQEGKVLIFAMNAGIYMENQMPLGLYIENGKVHRQLNTRKNLYGNFYLQPNGVFLISNNRAFIIETASFKDFATINKVNFATQSGPILLMNKKINPSLMLYGNNKLVRNAVCLSSENRVSFSISKQPVSFTELATHLKEDLDCHSALYLDGSISGVYLKENVDLDFKLYGPMIAISALGN